MIQFTCGSSKGKNLLLTESARDQFKKYSDYSILFYEEERYFLLYVFDIT